VLTRGTLMSIIQYEIKDKTEVSHFAEFEKLGLLEIIGVFGDTKLLLHLKHKEKELSREQIMKMIAKSDSSCTLQ